MKRKKKPTSHESQKLAAAQYRNEFLRKMKFVIDGSCGTHIFPLIPKSELEFAYQCRTTTFKFRAAAQQKIPQSVINEAKLYLSHMFRIETTVLPNQNLTISINDFFTVIQTIGTFYSRMNRSQFEGAQQIRAALSDLIPTADTYAKAIRALHNVLLSHGFSHNDMRKSMYWFKNELIAPKELPAEIENVLEIYYVIPESKTILIDEKPRPAFRLGWAIPLTGPLWLSLKPSLFGIDATSNIQVMEVYIQSHALNRLSERIDCFWTGLIQYNMFDSFRNPNVLRDHNNNILIEYRIFGTKAGYFRVDIVDNMVVVRTFLFITNNGTPEGHLLEQNTGLQKLDKKFLAIDKLSTFLASGLDENEEVRRIFEESGCGCLSELYEKMRPMDTKHASSLDSDLLLKYLRSCDANSDSNSCAI